MGWDELSVVCLKRYTAIVSSPQKALPQCTAPQHAEEQQQPRSERARVRSAFADHQSPEQLLVGTGKSQQKIFIE